MAKKKKKKALKKKTAKKTSKKSPRKKSSTKKSTGKKSRLREMSFAASSIPKVSSLVKTLAPFSDYETRALEGIDISPESMPAPKDVPGGENEPVYSDKDQADIQGNIIPGFNKGMQEFLFFRFGKRGGARKFLRWILPYISTMEEVLKFRQLFRERRLKLGRGKAFLSSTNVNVAFSRNGIALLAGRKEAAAFGDASFQVGLAERSTYLGDPTARNSKGSAANWDVGGPDNEADMIVIVASDCHEHLEELTALTRKQAECNGMELLFRQSGRTLPGQLRGHEHFGFKDGISQPGIRGKLSDAPGDYITPRFMADDDHRRLYFAKPGQLLVWPGQFLLGEPRQSLDQFIKEDPHRQENFPDWAKRGSYLVVRRLNQDVPAFWEFAGKCAKQLGLDPTDFASRLVGRWPSGAPLLRSPDSENESLGADEFANNHFLFDDDTEAAGLKEIPGYPGDNFPQAKADFLASVCPHFAHIRKVNPRDSVTDLGKPDDNLARMILRRGIPFGEAIVGKKKVTRKEAEEERGLMFLCYCTSIEDQFEFLQRRWSNSATQPNLGGHDPIIGQNGGPGRERFIDFPLPGGESTRISIGDDFVMPTGGGYFFAPTISAIRDALAK